MVASTDCAEKSKPVVGNKVCRVTNNQELDVTIGHLKTTTKWPKFVWCSIHFTRPFLSLQVSKPLMEKKRRARINKCLDQLKSLLESYYSTSVSMQAGTSKFETRCIYSFILKGRFNANGASVITIYLSNNHLMLFISSDSKAQTGKGRYPGAHRETSKEPPKDSELWVIISHLTTDQAIKYTNTRLIKRDFMDAVPTTLCSESACFSPYVFFPLLSGTASASEFPDYQTGFRSCLANVNQYLMMADNMNGRDRWMLSQLSSKLCRSRGREEIFSTMDSGPGQAEAQEEVRRLLPSAAGPEERKSAKSKAVKRDSAIPPLSLPSEDARQPSGNKQASLAVAPTQNTHEKSPSHKKLHSVSHRNEVANTEQHMWRPW